MLTLHLGAFLGSTHITNTVQKFKNILRTLWGWFVAKHPLNKNPISLTSEIMCSYMRVFTVFDPPPIFPNPVLLLLVEGRRMSGYWQKRCFFFFLLAGLEYKWNHERWLWADNCCRILRYCVVYLIIIPWACIGYELAISITNIISNKHEWNNCFIKNTQNI